MVHAADAGRHGHEGPNDGNESGEHHGFRSVPLEEGLGAVHILLLEEPRIGAPEERGPEMPPDEEPELVAEHRGDERAGEQQPEVQLGLPGQDAGGEGRPWDEVRSKVVIDRVTQFLLAAEVTLCRLNRTVAE